MRSVHNSVFLDQNQTTNALGKEDPDGFLWGNIWKMTCPFRIQLFLWKAIQDGIPTKFRLWYGEDDWDTNYPRCGIETETTSHALFFCREVHDYWYNLDLSLDFQNWDYSESVSKTIQQCYRKQGGTDNLPAYCSILSAIMYVIWTFRNELIFEQKRIQPIEAIKGAKLYIVPHTRDSPPLKIVKTPPNVHEGWHTVNVDAAWIKPDNMGELARAADPEEAEAIAVIRGMEAAHKLGLDRVLLLTDCQWLVRAFRDRSDDLFWGALTLALDMRALAAQFQDFHFDFVDRVCNYEAHFLAVSEMTKDEEEARPWQSYHTVFTNTKAGMDGVDKEKVQRIVYEMSKGSKFFENEERREAFIKQKIENMRNQCAKLTAKDMDHYQMVANKIILELEASRDLSKTWLHVDMDAFYAAVETLVNPSLEGKPIAVGGMSMICTANYEARKFGVRAAMPGFIARKLCPELIFVPTDFKRYTRYSELTRKVFRKYDPNFIASSLDEAYLDISEICKERGISSGEVCSDINKPNGQFILPNDRTAIMTFISSLPVRKIGGISKVTEHMLWDVLGINTCEEMLQKSAFLCALFSSSSTAFYPVFVPALHSEWWPMSLKFFEMHEKDDDFRFEVSVTLSIAPVSYREFFLSEGLGLGQTDAPQVRSRKSISSERTFSATGDEVLLHKKLAEIARTLSTDMQIEGLSGRTLTLKLKTASFELISSVVRVGLVFPQVVLEERFVIMRE
ncbi:hypothetical protein GIB67_041323 [Kingdonia uniflora]|uniref:DNA polymerase kappa n=1 Tax=Kingdonia uniflora TaxID=39325 RepID=A0A7J7NJJ4_9MAGN|nr:hypothetical protein GIB67_041323 [Kingdonia uniflora]